MGISRSRFALAIGVVSIATCSTLPIGTGATQAAELNSYISAYYDKIEHLTGVMPAMNFFDPMKARLPLLIFAVIYCAYVMPRFTPNRLPVRTAGSEKRNQPEKQSLPVFSEISVMLYCLQT